jgi:hypothetical protein
MRQAGGPTPFVEPTAWGAMSDNATDFFGPVIDSYSRAQAIEDGVLIDVTTTAREAGLVLNTVVTAHVWDSCVETPENLRGTQDNAGRLWDVLYMASHYLRAAVRAGARDDRLPYEVLVRKGDGTTRIERLVAVVGPGDHGEPVLTIMYPEDD